MWRFVGTMTLFGGLAAASATLPTTTPLQQSNLETVTRIATGQIGPAQTSRLTPPLPIRAPTTAVAPAPRLVARAQPAVTPAAFENAERLRVAAYAPAAASLVATGSAGPRLSSIEPADNAARYDLVKSIQAELKRAGCYHGSVDGRWSDATRTAMDRLVATVNARLPTETPDFILLALASAERDAGCNSRCTADGAHCGVEQYAAVTPPVPLRVDEVQTTSAVTTSSWRTVVAAPSPKQAEPARTRLAALQPAHAPVTEDAAPADAEPTPALAAVPRPAPTIRQRTTTRRAAPRRATTRRARARRANRRSVRVARRSGRRYRPTYRLRPRRARSTRGYRSSRRRFNTQRFWARMNRR